MTQTLALSILLAALALSTAASGQPRNHLVVAQDVLRSIFPEITGEVSVSLNSKTDADWLHANPVWLTVRQFDPSHFDPNRGYTRDVLSAAILIRNDGLIQEASFYGDYVKSPLEGVYEFVRASGATEENILAELRRRGVKYLPPDESGLLKALNLSRLAQSFGVPHQTDVELVALPVNESVSKDFNPFWIVRFNVAVPSGPACYSMMVDPMSLRVRRITKDDCKTP